MSTTALRFLLIEDNPKLARAVRRVIDGVRPNTLLASTAAEGHAAVATGERFLAIVTDVGLADGDGLDVVAAARDRDPDVPVLVMTGRTQGDWMARSRALGVVALVKPVGGDELLPFLYAAWAIAIGAHAEIAAGVRARARAAGLDPTDEAAFLALTLGAASAREGGVDGAAERQSIGDRLGVPNLDRLVADVLRSAVESKLGSPRA